MKRLALVLLLAASSLWGQGQFGGGGSKTKAIVSGPTLPVHCAKGDVFFLTVAPIGTRQCIAVDTWAQLATGAGSGDLTGPATNTDGNVPQWNGADSLTLKNGLGVASANTASAIVQRDGSGNFSAGAITANLTGTASAATLAAGATALAADPTDCGANSYATAIAASGNLTCAQPATTNLSNSAAVVLNNAGNAYSTGAQDFGSATSLKVPASAGAAPTASGLVAYDSTANAFKFGVNTATKTMVLGPATSTNGRYPTWNGTGGGTLNDGTDAATAATVSTLALRDGSGNLTGAGLIGTYFRSSTANTASAGQIRLAKSDIMNFKNNANDADVLGFQLTASDEVQIGGAGGVYLTGPVGIGAAPSGTPAYMLAITPTTSGGVQILGGASTTLPFQAGTTNGSKCQWALYHNQLQLYTGLGTGAGCPMMFYSDNGTTLQVKLDGSTSPHLAFGGTNAAATGTLRLPNNSTEKWKNFAGSGDLGFKLNVSDVFEFDAPAQFGGAGTSYSDYGEGAAPVAPADGVGRIYIDSGTHKLACQYGSGAADCNPAGAGGGTVIGQLLWFFPGVSTAGIQNMTLTLPTSGDTFAVTDMRVTANTTSAGASAFNVQRCTADCATATPTFADIYSVNLALGANARTAAKGGAPNQNVAGLAGGDQFKADLTTLGAALADVSVSITYTITP